MLQAAVGEILKALVWYGLWYADLQLTKVVCKLQQRKLKLESHDHLSRNLSPDIHVLFWFLVRITHHRFTYTKLC